MRRNRFYGVFVDTPKGDAERAAGTGGGLAVDDPFTPLLDAAGGSRSAPSRHRLRVLPAHRNPATCRARTKTWDA